MDKQRNTGNCNTGDWNAGNWNTGGWNTGDRNTGNRNTGSWSTGNWNAGNSNTGDRNTGNQNTGFCNTGDRNTGNSNTGSWNTGNSNTGNWNTGNWNTGFCNTVTPEDVLIFNRIGKVSEWEKADKPNWMYVTLTRWVNTSDMTNKEKNAFPSYITTDGYLKCYSTLQAAYIEAWEKASKEDRAKTFKLPNFDASVFREIFGFNPCDCVEEKREEPIVVDLDIITVNGVKYKKV